MNDLDILKVKWRCPSNIAIVKYWGKKAGQIPCNSSLSMTLDNAYTEVEVEAKPKENDGNVEVHYFFEGTANESFGNRVESYINANIDSFSFANTHAIHINSSNSFPHSAGIASSASAFGALSLALLELEFISRNKEITPDFYKEASSLARLGSGSASRSLYSGFAVWGETPQLGNSSNNYAVELSGVHPIFGSYKDAIIIVDDEPKKVSSSAGHALMNNHPFAQNRFEQASERVAELITILKKGDIQAFISLCESEALTLHAMMMTSSDYYMLFKPQTVEVIEKIMVFREERNIPVCFTLDAGPNVHLLYPDESSAEVESFIKSDLMVSCKDVLFDRLGNGPVKL